MIHSFKDKGTRDIYHGTTSKEARGIPQEVWKGALRKLDMVEAAQEIRDLRNPPGNFLEVLRGDLKGK